MIQTTTINGKRVKYFGSMFFQKEGRQYKIVGCKSTGKGIYDCIDTVKNDRGELKDYNRIDLIKFIES